MKRARAADDFAAIRARMEELRSERERAERNLDEEPTEARRRQVTEELKGRIGPRRNW